MAISTRSALRELRHSPTPPEPVQNNLNISGCSSISSPEEQVIQQRGRRKISHLSTMESFLLTPPKVMRSPRKIQSTPTRTSPRKRLNLGSADIPSSISTPPPTPIESANKVAKISKQIRLHRRANPDNLTPALKALSASQLVELMTEMIDKHPKLKEDISKSIPSPDLVPLEKRLKYLQRNVFKAMPKSHWGSKTDSYCYRRVVPHIDAFKTECLQQGEQLLECEDWLFVIDYVLMAFPYIEGLPKWDSSVHNRSKQLCFKGLTNQLISALKEAGITDTKQLQQVYDNLYDYRTICPIDSCLKFISTLISNLKSS